MTSKQLLLHIGTGKTGTTSIQASLHQAAADGTLGDICYPSPRGRSHNFIAALYMAPDRLPREYRSRYQVRGSALTRDVEEFRERLFRSIYESRRTILSAEYLGRFGRDELHALRTDLARLGVDEILVVVYVRDPASAYLSVVQQTLKAASTFKAPATYRYPFRQVLEAWSNEFADLVVRPFVKDRLVGGDVVRDFDDVASSFFAVDRGLNLPAVVKNQSVSAEGMIVLQRYRQLFHSTAEGRFKWDSSRLLQLLQESMGSVLQTRADLLPSAAQVIMRRHKNELDWLWRKYGVDLRGHSTDEPIENLATMKPYDGPRQMEDVTLILESYDEDVIDELLLYCVRQALDKQRSATRQPSKLRSETSALKGQLEDSRRDTALAQQELQQVLASRSWRWGHRMALILSSPRKVIEAFRRKVTTTFRRT